MSERFTATKDGIDVGADGARSFREGGETIPEGDIQRTRADGRIKEVIAFVRPRMANHTKEELLREGFLAVTAMPVVGRGQQGRLAYPEAGWAGVPYLPKCLLMLVVQECDLGRAIAVIVRVNRTGEIGDGKIFVAPVGDVRRIRTGERSAEALPC